MNKRFAFLGMLILLLVMLLFPAFGESSSSGPELLIGSLREATLTELENARRLIYLEQQARLVPYIELSCIAGGTGGETTAEVHNLGTGLETSAEVHNLRVAVGTGVEITSTVQELRDDLSCDGFSWESSDPDVAAVNKVGQIRGIAPGVAEITCRAMLSDGTELTAVCRAEVFIRVAKVAAENKALYITRGQTEQIRPIVEPEDAENPTVSYESSDPGIAAVSAEGLVTAVSPGPFSITVKANDDSGKSCMIKGAVYQNVEAVALEAEEIFLPLGRKAVICAEVLPGDAKDKKLRWSSDNEAVAVVNTSGQVSAAAVGSATVRAEAADGSGAAAECRITVVDPVRKIELSENNLQLIVGMPQQVTAEALPAEATIRTLSWSSSDPAVATVDETGRIIPLADGECVITAEAVDGSGTKAHVQVAVKEYDIIFGDAEPLTLTYESLDMLSGMFTVDITNQTGCVEAEGERGFVTVTPVSPGEDTVTVVESERMSGRSVKETWEIYVLPEAFGE